MQQHRCGLVGHAGIAIGRTGGHALEEGEHTAHVRNGVQCGHEMHLRGTGVGKAHVNTTIDQGVDQSLGTVHLPTPLSWGSLREPEDPLGVAVQKVASSLVFQTEFVKARQACA